MPKSKHRRKGKPRRRSTQSTTSQEPFRRAPVSSSGLFMAEHPFNELPRDELLEALIETGKEAQKKYPALRTETEEILRKYDPLHVLGTLAVYTLFAGLDESAEVSAEINATGLLQAHVELAQAIMLRNNFDELETAICLPQDFSEIFSRLRELSDSFTHSRLTQIERAKTEEEKGYLQLSERLRAHTQFVRNWGHYQEVIDLLAELYSTLDRQFEEITQLSATNFIELFKYMLATVEERWNSIFQNLSYVFSASTKRQKINRYFEVFPDLKGTPDEFVQLVKKRKISNPQLTEMILSHVGLRYPNVFLFEYSKLADHIGRSVEEVTAALTKLAYSFGDLEPFEFDHLFLANPVWERPIIALKEERLFCLMPQLFFGFSHPIMENLMSSDAKARRSLQRRRTTFLENKIRDLFQSAFPDAQVIQSVGWTLSGKNYETDLLVKIDSHLVIVEAKSGKIPWAALRGGIATAKTRIKELIADPAEQSQRLEDALLRKKAGNKVDLKIDVPFDLDDVNRIIKLAVTLEDFATIQSNTADLSDLGVMPQGISGVATMNIADLKVVMELLDTEAERIHYLDRRNQIQENVQYVGDELDLLAFYFDRGFDFGQFADGQTKLILLGMSKPIDDFYQSKFHGGAPAKPKRKMTTWFSDICDFLSNRKIKNWTEMAVAALSFGYEDQEKMETEFRKVCQVLKKTGHPMEDHINTVIYAPNEGGNYGMAFVAFFEEERENRHNIISNAASLVFKKSPVEKCLVLARDLNGRDYPYTTLVVATP